MSKKGITYVVASASDPGIYKVGKTTGTTEGRMRTWQTGHPTPNNYRKIVEFHSANCYRLEKAARDKLTQMGRHVSGEWFRHSVKGIVKVLAETADRLGLQYEVKYDSPEGEAIASTIPKVKMQIERAKEEKKAERARRKVEKAKRARSKAKREHEWQRLTEITNKANVEYWSWLNKARDVKKRLARSKAAWIGAAVWLVLFLITNMHDALFFYPFIALIVTGFNLLVNPSRMAFIDARIHNSRTWYAEALVVQHRYSIGDLEGYELKSHAEIYASLAKAHAPEIL